jgi:hypothetical protein
MSRKNSSFLIVLLIVIGVAGYFTITNNLQLFKQNDPIDITFPDTYTTEPLSQCITFCESDLDYPCCPDDFEENCIEKGDIFRWTDMHPGGDFMHECFQKAPDSGVACRNNEDCLSGVCDLEGAVLSKTCTLIEKELTGEKGVYYSEELFTATYSCPTPTPGMCGEARKNRKNPGGVSHFFKMDGSTLMETLTHGPIH